MRFEDSVFQRYAVHGVVTLAELDLKRQESIGGGLGNDFIT